MCLCVHMCTHTTSKGLGHSIHSSSLGCRTVSNSNFLHCKFCFPNFLQQTCISLNTHKWVRKKVVICINSRWIKQLSVNKTIFKRTRKKRSICHISGRERIDLWFFLFNNGILKEISGYVYVSLPLGYHCF